MHELSDEQRRDLEAAAFRRLLEHLRSRTDVQNIDLMNLAGFCRNCLSNWYRDAAAAAGIDLSKEYPKPLTTEVVKAADVVITMGCGDACPIYPGKRYLDWDLPDPAGKSVEEVREIRDEIDRRVRKLVGELVGVS